MVVETKKHHTQVSATCILNYRNAQYNNLFNTIKWPPFSNQEFRDVIAKYLSFSTPGLDHVFWRHLKSLTSNNTCLKRLVHITNTCIISQMVTYLVCDGWKYRFKVLMSRVRQATKDVVKSEV